MRPVFISALNRGCAHCGHIVYLLLLWIYFSDGYNDVKTYTKVLAFIGSMPSFAFRATGASRLAMRDLETRSLTWIPGRVYPGVLTASWLDSEGLG